MKCDFCSHAHVPLRSVSCKTHVLQLDGQDAAVSVDNWCACEQCHALIEADNADALAERCYAAFAAEGALPDAPKADLIDTIKQIHAQFFAQRSEEFSA